MPGTDPTWVQAGELGLSFVVILLCTWLVTHVLRTTGERERQHVEIINGFLPLMRDVVHSLSEFRTDVNDRFADIEKALGVKRQDKSSGSKGLHLHD